MSPTRDPRFTFTNRDRVAPPNRKSVLIGINYELQQLRRLTRVRIQCILCCRFMFIWFQFETDNLSDTTLFAFCSRLRNIRATTEQAVILQSLNRRGKQEHLYSAVYYLCVSGVFSGPAYTSGGERNRSTNGDSTQMVSMCSLAFFQYFVVVMSFKNLFWSSRTLHEQAYLIPS